MPKSHSWTTRVQGYVDSLEMLAEKIDLILDETRVGTIGVEEKTVSDSTHQLQLAIAELEQKVAQREELLGDADAPATGATLTEKLKSTFHIDDARLAGRCKEVSRKVQTTHQRATALFVCQFHLADITGDLLRAISGSTTPRTYQKDTRGTTPQVTGQGGLFDEAA